jgi:hypothetical protein
VLLDRYTTDFAAIKEIEIPKEIYPRNGSLVIMQGRRERVIQGRGHRRIEEDVAGKRTFARGGIVSAQCFGGRGHDREERFLQGKRQDGEEGY